MPLEVKNPPVNAGDLRDAGSILGLGRCPEEKMASHSGEKPGGLQSMGLKRVRHD